MDSQRRLQKHEGDEDDIASPEASRLLFLAFGIAALIGLVTGLIWVGWNLLRIHVFR
jgi:hypothetical protein